jgi:hypothetical protein
MSWLGSCVDLCFGEIVEHSPVIMADIISRDPSRLDPTPPAKWESKVLGMNKRDLLQEVLPILG